MGVELSDEAELCVHTVMHNAICVSELECLNLELIVCMSTIG